MDGAISEKSSKRTDCRKYRFQEIAACGDPGGVFASEQGPTFRIPRPGGYRGVVFSDFFRLSAPADHSVACQAFRTKAGSVGSIDPCLHGMSPNLLSLSLLSQSHLNQRQQAQSKQDELCRSWKRSFRQVLPAIRARAKIIKHGRTYLSRTAHGARAFNREN
jgi:hypothetical protein